MFQVRVKVEYCAVNATDIMYCDGEIETKLPFMPGFEIAGEILEAGASAESAGFTKGTPVIALNKDNHGGFAEQCVVSMNVSIVCLSIIFCYSWDLPISKKVLHVHVAVRSPLDLKKNQRADGRYGEQG